ncbi:MAG: type II-A CRISPR-associated protein Csn2 [Clostridia bacterium]|nr:type II-A CRISPR-associated protein Csn2 [Clostridia bacterium]
MKKEIQLAHVHLETQLIISDEYVSLLIIENPAEFYNMVSDLDGQFEGTEGKFVFSMDGQIIPAGKYGAMISNLFHFDLNDKKLLNLLYKRLEGVAFGDKITFFNTLTSKTVEFLEELSFAVPFALEYDEPQPSDCLKAAGLKFAKVYDTLEEKIICYINACIELKKCEFFVFVNLKSVLSDEQLQQVYVHCRAEQVGLFLIEDNKRRTLLSCEKAVIITEDLCELLENYEEIC